MYNRRCLDGDAGGVALGCQCLGTFAVVAGLLRVGGGGGCWYGLDLAIV